MSWKLPIVLPLAIAASALTSAHFQDGTSSGAGPATRVLTVTYADGVATSHVLGLRAAPFLAPGLAPTTGPRPSRPELPVTWLRFSPRAAGDRVDVSVDVKVDVQVESLGRDRSLSNRADVGRVSVTADPASLPAFAAVGVQGMTFSIAELRTTAAGEGRGLSSVRGVDLVDEPGVPGRPWRVEIQNRSGKPIRSARVMTFAAGRPARSLTRRGRDGTALMEPMEGYRPDLGGWVPHDFAIVTAVTWTDGTMAGDIADGIGEMLLDAAERVDTTRVTDAIRVALALPGESDAIAALKSAVASFSVSSTDAEFQTAEARLPIADAMPVVQLRKIMDDVIRLRRQEFDREIEALLSSRPARGTTREADRLWLQRTLVRYEAWKTALTR